MKYCTHCGKELFDEAVICIGCGCRVESHSNNAQTQNVMITLIKVFMIIGCVVVGLAGLLIPFCWTIPMTVHLLNKLEKKEPVSVGFKVCTLIFVSLIAGILLLCLDDKQLL